MSHVGLDPVDVFAALSDVPGAIWLDAGAQRQGWSILTWDPTEVVRDAAGWHEAARELTRPTRPEGPAPFAGGCAGYIGYGAGHAVEAVPRLAPTSEPDVYLGRYEGGLCFRHRDASWHAAGSPGFVADAHALLDAARVQDPPPPIEPRPAHSVNRSDHEARIRRILEWIREGDCYQVNLTRAVTVPDVDDPWNAYRRLRGVCDAAFGAFVRIDPHTAVLSNSPELFLDVRDGTVGSLPIKGTRPRHPHPDRDREQARSLLVSDKEKAELAMIVDLVRNDLGRVAATGTVRAGQRRIDPFPNVHHASQLVTATLAEGRDTWDAVAAAFPPGSVTGAPKVRACQRIAELECSPRGVYCGAIGYVADGGDACFNVAIRTAVWHEGTARYHVGGGIVADSDPAEEWWETVHKGTALGIALAGHAHPERLAPRPPVLQDRPRRDTRFHGKAN